MISRHWKGIARPESAEAYVHHLKSETFPRLSTLPGFISASILSRPVEEGTEFQIVTLWQSLESIRAFAGPSLDVAVVPPAARALLVSFDTQVLHYDVDDLELSTPRREQLGALGQLAAAVVAVLVLGIVVLGMGVVLSWIFH